MSAAANPSNRRLRGGPYQLTYQPLYTHCDIFSVPFFSAPQLSFVRPVLIAKNLGCPVNKNRRTVAGRFVHAEYYSTNKLRAIAAVRSVRISARGRVRCEKNCKNWNFWQSERCGRGLLVC